MTDLCSECKLVITALDSVSCDSCSRLFHKKVCSGLNASEIKVMELKGARQLKFFCPECQSGMKMVPTLIKAVEELRQEIDDLKKTPVMQTPPNIPVPSNTPVLNYNEADIFVELQERQNRANNLMIFNVPEGNNSEPDSDQVKKLISILSDTNSPQPRVLQTLRMGKPNKNNFRASRLTLESPAEVQKLIKCGHKLKDEKVFISFDLTAKERERHKLLQTEFRTRKANGENVVIRYQNRIPSIALGKNTK
ncbi:unnamed protein product [Ceutorhynchus assimilis]|uniref:Uncharacterized protein n=1 Tax=Ceutorhynchus assimilis TaxID=467358 RepID=A0A9N9ME95_9CUCU|nr:unnamed protein product [Ceutorhynchus assimilis]